LIPQCMGWETLCMKSGFPTFDPSFESLNFFPSYIRLPKFPLHFVGLESLEASNDTLGKFHFTSQQRGRRHLTTYEKLCIEMDLTKIFHEEIWFKVVYVTWMKKMVRT
jgi:hypothetical protein